MKALYVALKDMQQSFRSWFALAFMFGVPILITAVFSFMFGGTVNAEPGEFTLPATSVIMVNLDAGELGQSLVDMLDSESLNDIMTISTANSAEDGRRAVEEQAANVAVIIPENFSSAVIDQGISAEIEFHQDPTLTIGPEIVRMILNQFVEGFSGGKIVIETAVQQWISVGQEINPQAIEELINAYIAESNELGQTQPMVAVEAASGAQAEPENQMTDMMSLIMSGMMMFFAFFTAASTAMSIIQEDEKGTLARLFSTPTPTADILNGKFAATALVVFVQMAVLVIFGALVFKIEWGSPVTLIIVLLAATANAAGLGIFLNSLMRTEKQAGMVFGGVMTVMGMLGMIEAFVPNSGMTLGKLSLLVPQGWAYKALTNNMQGIQDGGFWLLIGGCLVWAAVFFVIGNMRFKRRFV